MQRLLGSRRGSALVESSLIFLVLMMTLIFVIDMGRMLVIQQFINERVRQTARKAAVNNWTSTQVKNYLVYGTASTGSQSTAGRLGLLPAQVSPPRGASPLAPLPLNQQQQQHVVVGLLMFR